MRSMLVRTALVGLFSFAIAACSQRSVSLVPARPSGSEVAQVNAREPAAPKVGGVYNGNVVETSNGHTLKAKLKITLKQSGNKFTGIFDIILKTVQDRFPIIKGVVGVSHGKTILHFTIEGSPGRNAKAVATLVGKTIKGKAKVSARNGPAVRFKYSAKS